MVHLRFPVFASTKNRAASVIAAGERDPYTWDFEGFSQTNYYGDRQRFNGDGCVNFHYESHRVQDPSDWKGAGNPPAGTDLAIYPQPRYKGKALMFVGLNKCHELKGDGVSSFQGHDNSTYTFYKDAGCKGTVLEKNKGPDSRTNMYMTPMSVMID
ncbi:hypothetical protein BGZ74_002846 [Mortierella antarctica]|nr:hypothetical protein BGZ74_002846 [Mortierella antarctica]